MKMRIFSLWILLMVPVLSGCWSRVEINDLALVSAEGVDKMEDGKIRVALQVAIPQSLGPAGEGGGGGKGSKATWVVSEKGATIMDAYRKIQEKLPRKIFFSHSDVIVIGESLAKDGVSPILDFFTRYREARMNKYILFTKGEALRILQFTPKFEKVSSEVMREEGKSKIGLSINLRDFVETLASEGVEPVAAEMEIVPSNVNNGEESPKAETNLKVKGTAVFKKDQLMGWMAAKETRGVLWLRNEIRQAVLTINIPKDKGDGKVSVQIMKAETEMTPSLKGGKLKMEVKIKAQGDLYESSSKIDLSQLKEIQFIEKKLGDDIQQKIQLTLDKTQNKFKSDIFGFGRKVQQEYPKEWEAKFKDRWDQEFPNMNVTITADVIVDRTGLVNKSMVLDEKEFKKK